MFREGSTVTLSWVVLAIFCGAYLLAVPLVLLTAQSVGLLLINASILCSIGWSALIVVVLISVDTISI